MKRLVYLTEASSATSEDFYRRALETIEESGFKNILYILPNGEIINKYRRRFIEDLKVSRKINLYTFDDIAKNLSTGFYEEIDDEVKFFIIRDLVSKLDDGGLLKYYKKVADKEGFIRSLIDIIARIKRSLIDPESFLQSIGEDLKFLEIAYIYRDYDSYLKENRLHDKEDFYFKAIENINKGKIGLDIEYILIDQFYDFRNIEWRIIESFNGLDIDIFVNIPFRVNRESININKTLDRLEQLDFKIQSLDLEDGDFKRLGQNLFSKEGELEDFKGQVKTIEAANKEMEVKRVFEDIKSKLLKGVKREEICINLINSDYKNILNKISIEEKLSLSISRDIRLLDSIMGKELMSLLSLKEGDLFKRHLINRLRSKFFPVKAVDKRQVYRAIKNLKFRSLDELRDYFNRERVLDFKKEELDNIYRFIDSMRQEIDSLTSLSKIKDYSSYALKIIEDEEVYETIFKLMDYDLNKFTININIYRAITRILENMRDYHFASEEIDLEDYTQLLKAYLGNKTIVIKEGKDRGVRVLPIINNRGFNFRYNYILGLSQDNYPSISDDNFIFNERNYRILNRMGIEYNNYEEKLDKAMVNFSTLVASTGDGLILSYDRGMDNENVSSIFIDEISRLLGSLDFEFAGLESLIKPSVDRAHCRKDYLNYKFLNAREDIFIDPELAKSYSLKIELINKRLEGLILREAGDSIYNGYLQDENVLKDMDRFLERRAYSASFLEAYARCPYSFLLARVLKLEDIYGQEEEYDYLLVGNIYHRVLYNYYKTFKDDIVKGSLKREEGLLKLEGLIENELRELSMDFTKKENKLFYLDLKDRLEKFLIFDLDNLEKRDLSPYEFEKEFNYRLEENEEIMNITGKIDRIDLSQNAGAVVIDYKTSSSNNLRDIREGISLQLPLYIMALEKLKPVAGVYGLINSARYATGLAIYKESKLASRRGANVLESREEWSELLDSTKTYLFQLRRDMSRGDFRVEPRLCSPYCPYKDICRYKREVILD